jgi:RES domain-containing protein
MILYHLDKWKYKDVWPPEGSMHADGRWNRAGQWILYTSPTISLAKLEILANENNVPLKRVCMTLEVPDTFELFEVLPKDLPIGWMEKPSPVKLLNFTQQFFDSGKLMMQVPSAQSYRESNFIINVRHKDFHTKVKLLDVKKNLLTVG